MAKKHNQNPFLSEEEILVEDRLNKAGIDRGVMYALESKSLVATMRHIKNLLDDPNTRPDGEAEAYGVCSALIKTEPGNKNKQGLEILEKSRIFKRMLPETGFALAIKAVRAGDTKAFQTIAETMKREHLFHPELARFKTSEGETLGHLAAQWDHHEIIAAIGKQNSDNLETYGKNEETIAHTASRFCSWKTIDLLIKVKIELFGRRNLKGETPMDLTGGNLIRTKIDLENVQQAEELSEKRKDKARRILISATKKKPGKPMVEIQHGRLKMERLPSTEPTFF